MLVRISKTSGTMWPEVRVYDSGGAMLCEAYSSTSVEIASCTVVAGGTCSIQADDYLGTNTGDYYLYLQGLNSPGNSVPIAFGQTLPGSILTGAEMDTYTFTVSPDDKVLVRMSKSSGTMWPEVRVYGPDG
ncbi:MAG: hypothetical protein JXM73_18465, partial [Anaerolineae bacterium]|nr:hypothetical protein [Anaerolineae bacterium]